MWFTNISIPKLAKALQKMRREGATYKHGRVIFYFKTISVIFRKNIIVAARGDGKVVEEGRGVGGCKHKGCAKPAVTWRSPGAHHS